VFTDIIDRSSALFWVLRDSEPPCKPQDLTDVPTAPPKRRSGELRTAGKNDFEWTTACRSHAPGMREVKVGNREKSRSVVIQTQPCSMACAARNAS
jgi:hypothetical protein